MVNKRNVNRWLVVSVFLLAMAGTARGQIIYVDTDANGANDGSSWADAYNYLQDALATASSGDQIWVAEGIYKPDQGAGVTPGDRTATFQLKSGLAIKGGYAGFGEPDPNERDAEEYATVLSGDLNGDDANVVDPCALFDVLYDPSRGENSYHVMASSGTDQSAVLDGFTVTGGHAHGSYPYNCGGGIFNIGGSSPTIVDCNFRENAAMLGGGVYNRDGCVPLLSNCTFYLNFAWDGGGVADHNSSPTLMNCTFRSNWGTTGGGMRNSHGSDAVVRDCTFLGNVSCSSYVGFPLGLDDEGAGMANYHSSPTVINCTFIANYACGLNGGGGMLNFGSYGNPLVSSDTIVINCTFVDNSATRGAGMSNYCGSPTVINSVFSRNLAFGNGGGGGIFNSGTTSNPSSGTFFGCILNGNRSTTDAAGIYNDEGNPSLTNCTIVDNCSPGYCNGLASVDGNPVVTDCILWGNTGDAQIRGWYDMPIVNHSCIQGWTGALGGIGNIGDNPLFADLNDYRLTEGSPCIDSGDNESLPADSHDLDGDGNTTEPIPWDLDGNARIVDGNNDGKAVVDMGAHEYYLPPIEVTMKLTPQAFNPGSKGRWVKAHFVLPEGYAVEDVDVNSPAKLTEPFEPDVESNCVNVFINEANLVEVEAAFDRAAFCGVANSEDKYAEVTAEGQLTSGQRFRGTDTIKIVSKNLECAALVASYWLETDCGKPDWCDGADYNEDSVVNLVDFGMLVDCCIEILTE